MINAEIGKAFNRIADLMEMSGEDGFRVNTYRRAGRFLKSYTEDIEAVSAAGELTKLPGIGKSTAAKIKQFIDTGRIAVLDDLESKLPAGLPDLLAIQSLGPKKINVLYEKLGIAGIDDLRKAIDAGEVAKLPGFGEQSVKKIAEGIAFLEKSGGRTPMGVAWPIAEALAEAVRGIAGVKRVEIAGSLRRGSETIGDVDLLCECDDGERIVEVFTALPGVTRVLASGTTKGSVTVEIDRGRELQVDLRVVPADSFGAALQYFTGSKEHNVRLREIAVKKKWRLNEYGLYDGDKTLAGRTEESIYEKLGVPYVPPEMREDRGEFDLADRLRLVSIDDIQGDLHMHTTASDGKCSIEQMAAAARKRGYRYIAITDHSKSSTIANGLSAERLIEHIAAVRAASERAPGVTLFTGCECDILTDGSLDYPDELLAQCDVVVASIHARGGGSKVTPTQRLLRAIANPHVTIIGHATGRLINKRPALEIDMSQVLAAAAENGTVMEINASWQRLDLKSDHVRQALDAGVMLAINTDAHHTDQLDQMRYGITTARRGWATAEAILNTKPLAVVRAWMGRKRG